MRQLTRSGIRFLVRSMRAGVVVVLLLAACSRHRAPGPPASELRVLVLNMHAGTDARGAPNLARVAELVRRNAADLVLLQEVDSVTERSGRVDQVAELRRLTGYGGAFGNALRYQGGGYGIAVLARAPIVAHDLIRLPVTPPQLRAGGAYEPRGALHVVVSLGSDTLHVLNTHLDPSGDDGYRRQEARTLAAAATALSRPGRLVLIGGDMNSTPESEVQREVRAAGLRDLWAECGGGPELTYPAEQPVKRIDYLYALGTVTCRSARVIDSDASDHRGVLFVLRLRGR